MLNLHFYTTKVAIFTKSSLYYFFFLVRFKQKFVVHLNFALVHNYNSLLVHKLVQSTILLFLAFIEVCPIEVYIIEVYPLDIYHVG